jgi:hypothetical protein
MPPKGKQEKRQHWRRQQRQNQKDSSRAMQKLATQQARELLRALKKVKSFELAKVARRIKAAAEEGKAESADELEARKIAVKNIAVTELMQAAVEKHHLQLLLEHSPKQF